MRQGFAIIELSFVILITALLIVGGTLVGKLQIEQNNSYTTKSNLEIIHGALLRFVAQNGRLPCPASLSLPQSNANYGLERRLDGAPASCVTSPDNILSLANSNEVLYMGAIPFRTLGLANEVMFDGWKNKIDYVVQRSFVNNKLNTNCITTPIAEDLHNNLQYICISGQASGSKNSATPDIEIRQYYNGPMVTNDAIYVLVSHGPNGLGAYRKSSDDAGSNTDRNALPSHITNIPERANTNCAPALSSCSSSAIADTIYVLTGGLNEQFDDIVEYKTRNQLIFECNYDFGNLCTIRHGIDFR
jgi:hypothetical protein